MRTEYNFESFAETPEYRRLNREMISVWIAMMKEAGEKRIERVLDIATGIGTMIRIFLEELPEELNHPQVICLDKSQGALDKARKRLGSAVSSLKTVHATAQEMNMKGGDISLVLWGNGIHNLSKPDQRESVKRIADVLASGGWFFFNTAFYENSRPEETLSFYRYQVKQAVRILRERGVDRDRGGSRAEAAKYHPRVYYRKLGEDAGLKIKDAGEMTAPLYRGAWEAISSFRNYASGALRGYPIGEAQSALREAVAPSLEKYGQEDEEGNLYIPRRWLAVAAKKVG